MRAIKVERRQRGPAYEGEVTGVLRSALDRCLADPKQFRVEPQWHDRLNRIAEGSSYSLGALDRAWQ